MSEATEQVAQLKRDGTMAVTAQEGKEFLEAQGMPLTDDDVKTRGQKEALNQLESNGKDEEQPTPNGKSTPNGGDEPAANGKDHHEDGNTNGEDKPKLARDSTMAVTANEGAQLLGGEELEKTRAQTAAAKNDEEEEEEDESDVAKLKRTTTVAQTTEDSQYILGNEEFGKTRSQTRKFSESETEKKPAVKRTSTMAQTAKEGEEFLARETKRTKEDEEATEEQETAIEA